MIMALEPDSEQWELFQPYWTPISIVRCTAALSLGWCCPVTDEGIGGALQVHDELLFEVKSSVLQQACSLIKNCMENAVALSVPFPVKLRVGPSWGELEPYHLQL